MKSDNEQKVTYLYLYWMVFRSSWISRLEFGHRQCFFSNKIFYSNSTYLLAVYYEKLDMKIRCGYSKIVSALMSFYMCIQLTQLYWNSINQVAGVNFSTEAFPCSIWQEVRTAVLAIQRIYVSVCAFERNAHTFTFTLDTCKQRKTGLPHSSESSWKTDCVAVIVIQVNASVPFVCGMFELCVELGFPRYCCAKILNPTNMRADSLFATAMSACYGIYFFLLTLPFSLLDNEIFRFFYQ